MDFGDIEDDDQDFLLTRSNSWSHGQRPVHGNQQESINIKPGRLSCIYETDDNMAQIDHQINHQLKPEMQRCRSKSISGPSAMQTHPKKRRHSYTELIASAILSSQEKRKTLAEIYDWFVLNVPSFKDQRYMHSSLGWKNAVRHNLSVQTCFKRVKRHGMEKPSWWTVDMAEVSKRRLVLRPTLSCGANSGTPMNGEIDSISPFLPPRRNTYSGPQPTGLSPSNCSNNGCDNNANWNIETSGSFGSLTDVTFGMKRTRYTPIRPSISNQSDGMLQPKSYGYTNCEQMTSMPKQSPVTNMSEFDVNSIFMKPCAVETPPMRCDTTNTGSSLVPSVTLVCTDPSTPELPYRQAQLELSLFQPPSEHQQQQSLLTPASHCQYNPNNSSSAKPNHHGIMYTNKFRAWPTNCELSTAITSGVPNQTLRVKTTRGNLQDVNFTGLLPMRTVVKRDGTTQTEQKNGKYVGVVEPVGKGGFNPSMWDIKPQVKMEMTQDTDICGIACDLPEDLANLQIEGDLHCDIDEVLRAGLDGPINKASLWPSSWEYPFDLFPYNNHPDEALMNVNVSPVGVQSQFNCAKINMSEM